MNQLEVDSIDQHSWRQQRCDLIKKLQTFCRGRGFEFFDSQSDFDDLEQAAAEVLIFVKIFDLIPDYEFWKQTENRCKICSKRVVVITDNILTWDDLELVKFISDPRLLGITANYNQYSVGKRTPVKLFNCFMQRGDSVRQSWFYFLHYYRLLDQGHVSYLLKQLTDYSTKTGVELYDFIHLEFGLDRLEKFKEPYQQLRSQVPYRNFSEQFNLVPLIESVKYNLVLETYATDDDRNSWCVTEKTLRPLQFSTISLIFAQKGMLRQMSDLGFAIVYNGHDSLSWQQRQQDLLQILTNDTLTVCNQDLRDAAEHNRRLLGSWKDKIHSPTYFEEIFETYMIEAR